MVSDGINVSSSAAFFGGESVVLGDSTFNLHLHFTLHVSSRSSSATVHNDYVEDDESNDEKHNVDDAYSVTVNFALKRK